MQERMRRGVGELGGRLGPMAGGGARGGGGQGAGALGGRMRLVPVSALARGTGCLAIRADHAGRDEPWPLRRSVMRYLA